MSLLRNKGLYTVLGVICLFVFTPIVVYILTLKTSEFEGARGYAFVYMLPVVFIGLAIVWFIDYRLFSKKSSNYFVSRNIIFLILILASSLAYYLNFVQEKKERKKLRINSHLCINQLQDEYEGFIIDTRFQTLRIRKKDSTYSQLKYKFKNKHNLDQDFYVGQKIWKITNEERFWVELKNGTTQRFYIPCYAE